MAPAHRINNQNSNTIAPHRTNDNCTICCKSGSLCAAITAVLCCGLLFVSACSGLIYTNSYFGLWLDADAEITGTRQQQVDVPDDQQYDNEDPDYNSYEEPDIDSYVESAYLRWKVGVSVVVSVTYLACSIYVCKSHFEVIPMGLLPNTTADTESPTRESPEERGVLILSKFHFQTVLEDMSNTTATSIRAEDKHDSETLKIEGGGEDDSSAGGNSNHQESPWSLAGATNMLSSWRKPSRDDECCICMETYNPGETVCVAKTTECDHVFHKDCISSWLQKNHECCPLCRIDLMK
jgi:hypothetical protein